MMKYSEETSAPSLANDIDELALLIIFESGEELAESIVQQLTQQVQNLSQVAVGSGATHVQEGCGNLLRLLQSGSPEAKSNSVIRQHITSLQLAAHKDREAAPVESNPAKKESSSLACDPEMLHDFVVEAREHLSSIENLALQLEQNKADTDAVHSLFRSFHSIKGLAAFLDLGRIQRLAHEVESMLDLVREDRLSVSPALIDAVLAGSDFLVQCVDAVEAGNLSDVPAMEPVLIERLQALSKGQTEFGAHGKPNVDPPGASTEFDRSADDARAAEADSQKSAAAVAPGSGAEQKGSRTRSATADRQSIRVETSKLDHLMDMVGEMVIAESLIRNELGMMNQLQGPLQRKLTRLAQITSEVQRTTMGLRMVPIEPLFSRTVRIVRDLARQFGKSVEIEQDGSETEIDKSILEDLADPLMHMVRNAVDHGIESPEEREAAGKPRTARVSLSAYHLSGQIVVQIQDDGRGIDPEKILAKARQKGLVGDEPLDKKQILDLIFAPGFSTAEKITSVSGRGVGMDVVRRQMDNLRGRIEIDSEVGKGTTFTLKLPLTRAIIDGLVVAVGDCQYVVPVTSVREVLRPSPEHVYKVQQRGEMVDVHGRMLPVVRLHQRFNVEPMETELHKAVLVVAEAVGRQFCLMVDELIGKQEVVIKSLGSLLGSIEGVSGGTILGDGRVGLVLDIHSLGGFLAIHG
jgi:two-component system, chemotaxis family, sensor kinase CheA